MSEIRVPYTGAAVIQVGGECYFLKEITTGNITHMAVDGEFSDCADCSSDLEGGNQVPECNDQIPTYPSLSSQMSLVSSSAFSSSLLSSLDSSLALDSSFDSSLALDSSFDSSFDSSLALDSSLSSASSEAVQSFLFSTASQGSIYPQISTFAGSLVSWDWGDGNTTENNNSPSYTYTDGQPSHDVKIYGVPSADIERIEVYGLLLNSLDVSPYTAVTVLQAFTNPYLSEITGLENLADLAVLTIGNNPLIGNQDLSHHPSLIYLGVEDTGKTLLDISANPLLYRVWAWGNSITELSVVNNPLISALVLYNNLLTDSAIDSIIIQLDVHGLAATQKSHMCKHPFL